MSDVFISYSRKDRVFVQQLHDALAESKRDVWVDWQDIPPTADWWKEICAGIEAADNFIFVISPESARSKICFDEIQHAIAHNKRIVPILREDVNDNADKQRLHPAINRHNWIFLGENQDFDAGFKLLITAIETDLVHVREHTRLLVRAVEWDNRARTSGLLLGGAETRMAETWLSGIGKEPAPTELHTAYILASRKAENRRQQVRFAGVSVALVVSLGLMILSLLLARQSEERRVLADRRADEAQSLALVSGAQQAIGDGRPDFGLALAFEANRIESPSLAARQALYDAVDHNLIRQRVNVAEGAAYDVDLNGETALVAAADGLLALWDFNTHSVVKTFNGHSDFVNSAAFSPDGQTALSASNDGSVVLWDVAQGSIIHRMTGHLGPIYDAAFSPDGEMALSAGSDRLVILWDLASGTEIRRFEGHTDVVWSVAFSPDGKQAVSGSRDNTLILWDIKNGDMIRRFEGHTNQVLAVDFSPDGKTILSGAGDSQVILWDVATGEILRRFEGHTRGVNSVVFNENGTLALSGGADNTVILWDISAALNAGIATGEILRRFEGHTDTVTSVKFVAGDQEAVSVSLDSSLIVWDMGADVVPQIFTESGTSVESVAFSPDGKLALSGTGNYIRPSGEGNELTLWDVATGKEIRRFESQSTDVNGAAFSPDGRSVLSSTYGGGVTIWDVNTGEAIQHMQNPGVFNYGAALSPDGQMLLTGGGANAILWNTATGLEIRHFGGINSQVRNVAFSLDGKLALAAADGGVMVLWDVASGHIVHKYQADNYAYNVMAFSPDEKTIITNASDHRLLLLDIETGDILRQYEGHTNAVRGVAFSPDGQTLVSGAYDNQVIVWDVASASILRRFTDQSWILTVAFSPDGNSVLSGSEGGRFIRWHVPYSAATMRDWVAANRYVSEFTCDQRERYLIEPLCDKGG